MLARFLPNGLPDLTFGTNGLAVTPSGYGVFNMQLSKIAILSGGEIIAVGSAGSGSAGKFFALRVNADGSRNAAFGSNGVVITDITADPDAASGGVLQPDGKIVAATRNLRAIRFQGDALNNLARPTAFDFDGDGWADFSVTRETSGHFNWYAIENPSNELLFATEWGESVDKRVLADYDGDRKTDVAVFRPRNGVWYIIRSSDNTVTTVQFGQNGDVPVAADFDGDGRADTAVFAAALGIF